MSNNTFTKIEIVDIEDIQTEFLSLRIGEEIPSLEIKQIRKIINEAKEDNLPGVNYKYIIETTNKKILTVNSWILWKNISSALKKAGKIKATLKLRHNGIEDYSVQVI